MPRYTVFIPHEKSESEEEHETENCWNLVDYDNCLYDG